MSMRPDGGRERPWCPECHWTYYAKPALGAAAIIEEHGQVLLVQRGNEPYRGWWTLPTGFVEYGEDAAESAAREVLEETGLVVRIVGCQGIFAGNGDPRGSAHVAVFYAHLLGGLLSPGDDAADARWFAPTDVPVEIAFEGHRKSIAEWLAAHGASNRASEISLFAGTGPAPPVLVYAVIENPKGTVDRIWFDASKNDFCPTGEVFSDPLPMHYGFIPRTVSRGDLRELDVLVVGEGETSVGSVIAVRPIGALLREDADHKVLAVRADVKSQYASIVDVSEEPALREVAEDLFRRRATLVGWATSAETRGMIMDAQRTWIASHATAG
ncbi:MAG: putative ADP-ribose pyrophosphatase [Chloroflexi bacterium]|nr:putative ADP-ribose pyrophosphatase [Chloroflexota bacterium]